MEAPCSYCITFKRLKHVWKRKIKKAKQKISKLFFSKICFALKGRFPAVHRDFSTLLHNDPAAHLDYRAWRCRIETQALYFQVWCTYQWATTSPHPNFKYFFFYQEG